MRNRRWFAAVGLVCLVLAACGKKGKSAVVTKLEGQVEPACACKDVACADGVAAAVQSIAEGTGGKVDDEDLKPLQEAQAKIDACLAKANPLVTSYVAIADQACACKDKPCAEKAAASFSKWVVDLKAKTATKKMRASDAEAIKEPGKKAGDCLTSFGVPIPK